MKLLFGYTLDYIKRNRRSSLAIMVAILMTSTMLSALCSYFYNVYFENINMVLQENGNWHGELFDDTPGNVLPVINSFNSVEATMIKGSWKAAQIDDPRRDYLVWRDANTEYWNSMPEGSTAILEGRVPASVGEIALSKQYFEHHPDLKLGDVLTLPCGNRMDRFGSVIYPTEEKEAGEHFVSAKSITLKVVGKLDVATSSVVPAYTALGFLDEAAILPQDNITVYLRFRNIHDTYKELPKIAAAIGYEPDEYGDYLLRYNTAYLTRRAVLSPQQTGVLPMLLANQAPLMFTVMGLLAVGLFVLIIHNAFSLSSSARLSQLGIFASVGATPKQIKRSVVLEALLLTVIPLPLGIILGQLSVFLLINFIIHTSAGVDQDISGFVIGWQSVLPSVLLTVLTSWWSALIPARRIARMSPISAIRQGGTEKLKKPGRFSLGKSLGLTGELAGNALQARKKSYRTATISLTLSFLILICFLCINSASAANKAIYRVNEKRWENQDIRLTLYNVSEPEDFSIIQEKIKELPTVESVHWYNTLNTAVWLTDQGFSKEFKEKGGFASVEESLSGRQVPLLRDGKRRVPITILGLDDETFLEYCDTLGIEPEAFYEPGKWRSILYHTVNDVATSTLRIPAPLPFLSAEPGDIMKLTEEADDSCEGDFTFNTEILTVADEMPPVGSATFGIRYSAIQIMPMSQVKALAGHFAHSNMERADGVLLVSDPAEITPTRTKIEEICESYFGSGDYRLYDEEEYWTNKTSGDATIALLFGFTVGLLTIIGLSNVWATVRGTLNSRRREFAMLRSVGLPPQGLRRMLWFEALMLGLTPILIGIPVAVILQSVFLSINEVTFLEWLPYAPWPSMLLYIAAVLAVVIAAYGTGAKGLLRENIIDAIKADVT